MNKQREGSSPHARGKRISRTAHPRHHRLIPACAGKTFHSPSSSSWATAHPRMRGENTLALCLVARCLGSSPHARGKRDDYYRAIDAAGLIPACAGKTLLELVQWRAIEPTRYNLSCDNYPHEAPLARGRMRTIIK